MNIVDSRKAIDIFKLKIQFHFTRQWNKWLKKEFNNSIRIECLPKHDSSFTYNFPYLIESERKIEQKKSFLFTTQTSNFVALNAEKKKKKNQMKYLLIYL